MDVTCSECRSVYRVDPAKVPEAGVDARCAVCGAVMRVTHAVGEAAAATTEPDVPFASSAVAAPPLAAAPRTPPSPAPAAPAPLPPAPPPVSPASPASPASPRLAPRVTPGRGEVARSTPQRAVGAQGPPAVGPAAVGPAAGAAPGDTKAPRRYNPYLSNDPSQRARRLARALVSDLVAYHPQKREEGLRNGTLKELFREEIRKSWDEYVEQVGPEVSENSAHFQDALNDLLAGGRRVF